jgi:hypothetical protein
MADETRDITEESVAQGKLPWSVCWDGYRGPIATRWAVIGFPTIYVVDPKGKIAGIGLRGEALKQRIAEISQ